MDINLIKISKKIKKLIIQQEPEIITPFGKKKAVFADFTASGRPSPIIEKYITENILPYYSNTHSNAYCGIHMKNLVTETKKYIRKTMNIDDHKKIIFCGSGTTATINHLIYCLKLEDINQVNVFLTTVEHHSNYLPWIELSKRNKNVKIHIIPIKDTFDIDIPVLEEKIKNTDDNTVNIVSITACSNVLGIHMDMKAVYDMLQKYNVCGCCYGKKNLLFVDYACSGPYVKIQGNYCDALFLSPHKFLGGFSTPGILIANAELFKSKTPYAPGGNCIKNVDSKHIEYDQDIEKKESAGTPNIVGIIKVRKILELKESMMNIIDYNEHAITKYVFCQFKILMDKHKNLQVILPDCSIDKRLPIVCISIKDIHYNLLTALLNDLFGIQARGGVSCTALLAELIELKYGMKGWCRITFNWIMDKEEIDYIINAVKFILENIDKYKNMYVYDKKTNLFTYRL
ncbi:aminotransferase class-V [Indivirus ILV1]|uniref:NifS-like protein n=1 Tax=Indivirus ILV1 TaxID=1977633 RepID=A0A1V0SDD5_9VIRU|nr:aminotransferase class-V [Indivirus ILV1]